MESAWEAEVEGMPRKEEGSIRRVAGREAGSLGMPGKEIDTYAKGQSRRAEVQATRVVGS